MARRQADELLLAQRLRDGLGQGRASIGRIWSLERNAQVAVGGGPQERADIRVGRAVVQPRQPGASRIERFAWGLGRGRRGGDRCGMSGNVELRGGVLLRATCIHGRRMLDQSSGDGRPLLRGRGIVGGDRQVLGGPPAPAPLVGNRR